MDELRLERRSPQSKPPIHGGQGGRREEVLLEILVKLELALLQFTPPIQGEHGRTEDVLETLVVLELELPQPIFNHEGHGLSEDEL